MIILRQRADSWRNRPAILFEFANNKRTCVTIVGRFEKNGFNLFYIYSRVDRRGYGKAAIEILKNNFGTIHGREVRSSMGVAFFRKMRQMGLIASIRRN